MLAAPTLRGFRRQLLAAVLGTNQVNFTQKNVTSKILDAKVSEGDLEAFIENNGWDPAQPCLLVNNPPQRRLLATIRRVRHAVFVALFFGSNAVRLTRCRSLSTAQRADAYPKDWDTPNKGKGCLGWDRILQGTLHCQTRTYFSSLHLPAGTYR